MGIQPSEYEQESFKYDTLIRQAKVLNSLTYKLPEDIIVAIRRLEDDYPQDNILSLVERIIRFLRFLK
jgi:hypothetical protein